MKIIHKRHQSGASLLEVLIALALMGVGLVQVGKITNENQQNSKYRLTAEQHRVFMSALERYAKDNYGSLLENGSLTAKPITVSTLIAAHKLPSGFSEVTPYGQRLCGLYSVPSSNSISILAVSEGGIPIEGLTLKKIAALIGHYGGSVSSTGLIEGAAGSWSISNTTVPSYANFSSSSCSGTSISVGSLASYIYLDNSSLATDFLRRNAISGQPTATAMSSPLGLAIKVEGTSCGSTSGDSSEQNRITVSSNGEILICKSMSGTWSWQKSSVTSYLKDPVPSFSALPYTNNTTGDVRITLDNNRAFFWNSATWKPLAVDSAGNLDIPGGTIALGSGKLVSAGSSLAIRTPGNVSVTDTTGANAANLTAQTINPSLTASYGSSCSAYDTGTIARDPTGVTLSCSASKVWTRSSGYAPNQYYTGCSNDGGALIAIRQDSLSCHSHTVTYICNNGKFDKKEVHQYDPDC